MLELKNIKKTYRVGDIETVALSDISVTFREKEFVSILGTSGSGKTTCLNIIGGLDRYDSGDLIIKGKHTKDFSQKDWDAYRNNSIGFVFQSYNLISHLSIVANVELGMTLSGVSKAEKRKRALDLLRQVGLSEHLHKKPNQLSGGQMQRVAIARALANDPEILLCDEPTGALDTETSKQIMQLIKQVANDRLVIMVTHNPELAREYSDRIIRFSDGRIISDSDPYTAEEKPDSFKLKRTRMSFFTALSLSANNLRTKKGRTFLTSFASSIGIIGIALIIALSDGFKLQIQDFQSDVMAEFPIIISQMGMSMSAEDMNDMHAQMTQGGTGTDKYADSDRAYIYDPAKNTVIHQNKFTDEYLDYLNGIDPAICKSIGSTYLVNMNLIGKNESGYFSAALSAGMSSTGSVGAANGISGMGISSYPENLSGDESYLSANYDLLLGSYPSDIYDIVLIVDSRNRLPVSVLGSLGFDAETTDTVLFSDIVGKEYKLISNNDYYIPTQFGTYLPTNDPETAYNAAESKTLRICGVLRQKEDSASALLNSGLAYSDALAREVINDCLDSDIVKAQQEADYNIFTREEISDEAKQQLTAYLGGSATPFMLMVFPKDFDSKEKVLEYLDDYNHSVSKDDMVIYTDLASTMSSMTNGIIDGILIVLLAFAMLSLVVSIIMICIITYTSVLERTKEIGVLRALGARKKDITRVFVAETCLLGLFSGLLGIGIAYVLCLPTNMILESLTGLVGVAQLNIVYALLLVVIATVMTMLGGFIPSVIAANKDAVVALRSE
ncbi:MAG: ATP-binding cassette domain-containing protein [Firmicutes bacterium]|nr:ATP-binding cassette domain-containing protein [Bacillota bacterium]